MSRERCKERRGEVRRSADRKTMRSQSSPLFPHCSTVQVYRGKPHPQSAPPCLSIPHLCPQVCRCQKREPPFTRLPTKLKPQQGRIPNLRSPVTSGRLSAPREWRGFACNIPWPSIHFRPMRNPLDLGSTCPQGPHVWTLVF